MTGFAYKSIMDFGKILIAGIQNEKSFGPYCCLAKLIMHNSCRVFVAGVCFWYQTSYAYGS